MKQSGTNKKTEKKEKRDVRPGRLSAVVDAVSHILGGRGIVVGEKLRSDVTAAVVAKYAIYAVISISLVVAQTTFFSRFRLFGASPDILITAVAAIALFEGERAGAVFGVAVGFAADALGGVGVVLLPLAYMLVGYICGTIATEHYRRSWFLFLLFDLGVAVFRMMVTLLYIMLTWHAFNISVILGSVLLPELLSTLAASPIPALITLPVYLIFRKKKKERD